MRAFIHAFQGKPWNEECEAAYNGFQKLGIECVLFTTNEQLDERTSEDIVVGGMLIMGHALTQLNVEIPNYNYPEELIKYRGRNIWIVKLKDLKQISLPVFIKPVEEKAAKGVVVNSWDDASEYEHLDPDSEILCSDVVKFVSEWRCFIRYGEILAIQYYYGDSGATCDRTVVENAVKDYSDIPAACSLDFGVTDDGRTLLIEMNDGLAIRCYGLDDELYAKFLYARWAELVGVEDPWQNCVRKGYVESWIRAETDKVWDAYLSIDVKAKDGFEPVSEKLLKDLHGTTQYLGMKKFFEENLDSDVWITDSDISLKDSHDLLTILRAITGKDVMVHLRVDPGRIDEVNQYLEQAVQEEAHEGWSLIKWRSNDKDYILELMKRLPGWSEYIVRLYEDGNGVIIYTGKGNESLKISYFKLKDNLRNKIISAVEKKIDDIIAHPYCLREDDRCFGFSVHLKYNIYWRNPDADKFLKEWYTFEHIDYGDDENKMKIAKMLLSAPEIKSIWMKMHE